MIEQPLTLILVTTTRADWGILSPLARALTSQPGVRLVVAAGNMHLSPQYGHTIDEIFADGFNEVEALDTAEADTTPASRTRIAARTAESLARLIERVNPDGVILLGDRYEILGAATAALIANVPIVHLHGGEISEGAIDNQIRHAVSKMASLHLVATAQSASRLQSMGEDPDRIVHTGAIGVENITKARLLPLEEVEDFLDGFRIDPDNTLLVTFHPVTRHPGDITTVQQIDNLLGALHDVPECRAVVTFPNNDTGSEIIIERICDFARRNPDRIKLVKSLGNKRFLTLMHNVRAMVGNSSSGIIEAPSAGIATINIGPRQQGRERAASVRDVPDSRADIAQAIRDVLGESREKSQQVVNPYYRKDSVARAVTAITELLPRLSTVKKHN